jgi:hypothetical protein
MQQLYFHYGLATGSEYDEDNYLGIQIDHFGEAGSVPAETVMPFGLLARPLDPEVDGDASPQEGCTTMWNEEGSRTNAMPLSDNRVNRLLPKLRKGGSMHYCGAGNYALFDGLDPSGQKRAGSYYVGVKYGSKSHLLAMVNRDEGQEFITLVHGEGHGLMLTGTGSAILKNKSGNAYLEASDDGINIAGNVALVGSLLAGDPGTAASLAFQSELESLRKAYEAQRSNFEARFLAVQMQLDAIQLAATAACSDPLGANPATAAAGVTAALVVTQRKARVNGASFITTEPEYPSGIRMPGYSASKEFPGTKQVKAT